MLLIQGTPALNHNKYLCFYVKIYMFKKNLSLKLLLFKSFKKKWSCQVL